MESVLRKEKRVYSGKDAWKDSFKAGSKRKKELQMMRDEMKLTEVEMVEA